MSAISAIPQDIFECAEIDGATGFKKSIYITLPMIWNSLKVHYPLRRRYNEDLRSSGCSDKRRAGAGIRITGDVLLLNLPSGLEISEWEQQLR